MPWKAFSAEAPISPIPARSIGDLELEESMYKPDFEITAKFQAFSKELGRISLLGIAIYGFLIKLGAVEQGVSPKFMGALLGHRWLAGMGVIAFAVCAICSLWHGYLASKCLWY